VKFEVALAHFHAFCDTFEMHQPHVRIDHSGERPTVVKTATDGPAAQRVRAEIAALRAAQHPGVVALVSSSDDERGVELRTRFCGSRSLATATAMPVERVAGVVAALAATVADLHEIGIAHRRITADHVLVGTDGRPVLCGFAEADCGTSRAEQAHDVASIGTILFDLLAPMDDVAPIPVSRVGRGSAWPGYHRRALLNLADQATADDPLIRPTARQLAHNIRATVPGATLADPARGSLVDDMPYADLDDLPMSRWDRFTARFDARWGGRRVAALAGVGLGILGLVAVALAVPSNGEAAPVTPPPPTVMADGGPASSTTATSWRSSSTPTSAIASSTVTTAPASTTTTTTTTTPTTPRPEAPVSVGRAAGCGTLTNAGSSLATGAACPVEMGLADGVLTVDRLAFDLGLADAAVALGDFACDGAIEAAVLDRATGDLFVFDRWASDHQPATATARRRIEAASRLLAERHGPCHRLVVLDHFGVRHLVHPLPEEP
jgi:eukaryotic-like serine/threonine-protein kinase